MNGRIAGIVLCLGIAAMPQVLMAQPGQGRGAEMRNTIPGEQVRQDAGRSADVRRDGIQRDRRDSAAQPEPAIARAERMRESEKAWKESVRERNNK